MSVSLTDDKQTGNGSHDTGHNFRKLFLVFCIEYLPSSDVETTQAPFTSKNNVWLIISLRDASIKVVLVHNFSCVVTTGILRFF